MVASGIYLWVLGVCSHLVEKVLKFVHIMTQVALKNTLSCFDEGKTFMKV